MVDELHAGSRYSDLSPFVRLLGTKGRVQILDTLIRKPHTALSAQEIADYCGISKSTFARNKDELIELEMIEEVESGGAARYRINTDNDVVQTLVSFHIDLADHAERILNDTTTSNEEIIAELARQTLDDDPDTESTRDDRSDYSPEVREATTPL